jgi:hypothetical protein
VILRRRGHVIERLTRQALRRNSIWYVIFDLVRNMLQWFCLLREDMRIRIRKHEPVAKVMHFYRMRRSSR